MAESNESAIKCRVRHATLSVSVDEQAFYITHSFFNGKLGQIRAFIKFERRYINAIFGNDGSKAKLHNAHLIN